MGLFYYGGIMKTENNLIFDYAKCTVCKEHTLRKNLDIPCNVYKKVFESYYENKKNWRGCIFYKNINKLKFQGILDDLL